MREAKEKRDNVTVDKLQILVGQHEKKMQRKTIVRHTKYLEGYDAAKDFQKKIAAEGVKAEEERFETQKADKQKSDKMQAEKLQAEKERQQAEKLQFEKERQQAEKLQAEKQVEKERQQQAEKLQAEKERQQAEKQQAERLLAEKLQAEKLAAKEESKPRPVTPEKPPVTKEVEKTPPKEEPKAAILLSKEDGKPRPSINPFRQGNTLGRPSVAPQTAGQPVTQTSPTSTPQPKPSPFSPRGGFARTTSVSTDPNKPTASTTSAPQSPRTGFLRTASVSQDPQQQPKPTLPRPTGFTKTLTNAKEPTPAPVPAPVEEAKPSDMTRFVKKMNTPAEQRKTKLLKAEDIAALSESILGSVSSEDVGDGVDDMTKLDNLTEGTILKNIQVRYNQDKIYTFIGPIVVSMNPFKRLEQYGPHLIPQYEAGGEGLPPHPYALAHRAFCDLRDNQMSQSVIISGESGAGKTEATKIVLKYLTVASGGEGDALATMILATNPLLEAFGNAKTIANNNSSRFGKFIKILFEDTKIVGASINQYLLEKTRVVHQGPDERNYHIFYALIKGASPDEQSTYQLLEQPEDYRFMTNGNAISPGIDDAQNFEEVKKAFRALEFDDATIESVFKILSGILRLGNVEFDGVEKVTIRSEEELEAVCELFGGCGFTVMKNSLEQRLFSAGNRGTSYTVPLRIEEAIENRDALAKAVYSALFDWLIGRLNEKLLVDHKDDQRFIGVLDIYGFEVFKHNSLEQFCINYANEKLHQQFNEHMFITEQEEYTKEGIPWTEIQYIDNAQCINLIEGRGGLIAMINDEGKQPGGTDLNLIPAFAKLKENAHIIVERQSKDTFKVRHFASVVPYNVVGMLAKNKDTLKGETIEAVQLSSDEIMLALFPEAAPVAEDSRRPGLTADKQKQRQADKVTVTQKFKSDLSSLVAVLSSSNRHYIRCITPNSSKSADLFTEEKVLHQLRCTGIMETIKLRKAGFANRMPFETWAKNYDLIYQGSHDPESIAEYIRSVIPTTKLWAVGNTKVFMRDRAVDLLNLKKVEVLETSILVIQGRIRCFHAIGVRNKLLEEKRRKLACIKLQTRIRIFHAKNVMARHNLELQKKKALCAARIQGAVRRVHAILLLGRLRLQFKAKQEAMAKVLQSFVLMSSACVLRNKYAQEAEKKRMAELEQKRLDAEREEQEQLVALQRAANAEEKRRAEEAAKAAEARKRQAEEEAAVAALLAIEKQKQIMEAERKRKAEEKQKKIEEEKRKAALEAERLEREAFERETRELEELARQEEEARQREREEQLKRETEKRKSIQASQSLQASLTESQPDFTSSQDENLEDDFFYELDEDQQEELVYFFRNTVGIGALANYFIKEAIDLRSMLLWKAPNYELRRMGIKQEGVISRVSNAIKFEQETRGMDSVAAFPSSMYIDSEQNLSQLGTLVTLQAEQLLNFAKSDEARQLTKKTELTATVRLDIGTEFTFTFSVGSGNTDSGTGDLQSEKN